MNRAAALFVVLFSALSPLRAEEEEQQPSPVDTLLEQVSRDLKKLSRQFDNPQSRSSSLVLADALIEAATKAKDLRPRAANEPEDMTPDEYMALYHKGMDELVAQFRALKTALEADEVGAAEAAMEEAYALREKYHKQLNVR